MVSLSPQPQPQPQPPPTPRTCTHADAATSRRCRMPVAPGETLCGAHDPASVPCPKCSTPCQPGAPLARHLSKPLCPVQKQALAAQNSPFYRHNANLPHPPTPSPSATRGVALTALLPLLPSEPAPRPLHPLPENERVRAAWSDQRDHTLKMEPKHFAQIAALSSLLLTPPPTRGTQIIELAAGRAYTSLYLAHVLNLRRLPCAVVAVDRGASRHKADRTLRAWVARHDHSLASFQRLRVDLAHLHLPGIPGVTAEADVRIVGKHACGAALDLSLTAATNFATVSRGNVQLVLASCCRNLCSYHAFGNNARVWIDWGVSEELFGQICKAALWGLDKNHDKGKADMGRKCRLLIDHARVEWLRSVGWDAHVTTYTEASPENACIVAFWKGHPEEMREKQTTKNCIQPHVESNFTNSPKHNE